MAVQLQNRQTHPVPRALIRRLARRALKHLKTGGELSLVLVDDAQMRTLNRRYRRFDQTTDVLAFPQDDPAPRRTRPQAPPRLLGDVVISVETAVRRVGATPRRLYAELARCLIHGILHLHGWDHHTVTTRQRMRRRERAVWSDVWGDEDSGVASGAR